MIKFILRIFFLGVLMFGFLAAAFNARAQENVPESPPEKFYKAKVLDVNEVAETIRVRILNGDEKGKELDISDQGFLAGGQKYGFKTGETVVVVKTQTPVGVSYNIADKYRLSSEYLILGLFFAVAVFFGRVKGLSSILGLIVSILTIAIYVVPKILEGQNPILVTLVGSLVIASVSIFFAHGFNRRAVVATLSTILTLGLASILAVSFVKLTKLFGMGSEEAFNLTAFPELAINFQGLLLGGIIIGTLGVLDDITASQAAAVDEIRKANPGLPSHELYRRGLSVGREHIAAFVNTLALAYAGSSLPLFLLLSVNKYQPLWVILNSEFISEELVRTLVGSTALILAVPISTLLAARFLAKSTLKR